MGANSRLLYFIYLFIVKFIIVVLKFLKPVPFNFIYLFILYLTVLGLHCCASLSLVAKSGDYSLVGLHRLLIAVASLVAEHGL